MESGDRARLQLRLPADCKAYIEQRARFYANSMNAEIVRVIREQMQAKPVESVAPASELR